MVLNSNNFLVKLYLYIISNIKYINNEVIVVIFLLYKNYLWSKLH